MQVYAGLHIGYMFDSLFTALVGLWRLMQGYVLTTCWSCYSMRLSAYAGLCIDYMLTLLFTLAVGICRFMQVYVVATCWTPYSLRLLVYAGSCRFMYWLHVEVVIHFGCWYMQVYAGVCSSYMLNSLFAAVAGLWRYMQGYALATCWTPYSLRLLVYEGLCRVMHWLHVDVVIHCGCWFMQVYVGSCIGYMF